MYLNGPSFYDNINPKEICVKIYFQPIYAMFKDNLCTSYITVDRLCGLVRVSGYRSRGPGFDSRSYHIFSEVWGLELGPLSLVRDN
jgi:hypothetical protein